MREEDRVDRQIRNDMVGMVRTEVENMLVEVFDSYTRLCMCYQTLEKVVHAQIGFFDEMGGKDAMQAAQQLRDILRVSNEKVGPMTNEIFTAMAIASEEEE